MSRVGSRLSAMSLVGAPLWPGVRDGGGTVWLQDELSVPLPAVAPVVWVLATIVVG